MSRERALSDNLATTTPLIEGLAHIAHGYDLILCDVWGVVHNGVRAYAAACDALVRFRAAGGTVLLVSNAPRPFHAVIGQLDGFGVPRAAFDALVTSGDVARALMLARDGEPFHHIGPARDLPLIEGLEGRKAGPDEAAFVVVSGLLDDETETAEDYRERLEAMAERGLTLVCANPDLVVERGERLVPCAGSIAALYESMNGPVIWCGKPHRPIYEAAFARAAELTGSPARPQRTLAIGDAIRTDVAGAAGVGAASLFVTGGIHGRELGGTTPDAGLLAAFLSRQRVRPDAAIGALAW
jgi:HAD superfamily hydrolase (TIGR01459 family)